MPDLPDEIYEFYNVDFLEALKLQHPHLAGANVLQVYNGSEAYVIARTIEGAVIFYDRTGHAVDAPVKG